MPKFNIYIRQTCSGGPQAAPIQSFKGFVDIEGNELVNEIHRAGSFTLEQAGQLIANYEYEQCKVTSVELKRAELDVGLVDTLIGVCLRTRRDQSVPPELGEIATELRVDRTDVTIAWQAGTSSFIDYINEQIESYN